MAKKKTTKKKTTTKIPVKRAGSRTRSRIVDKKRDAFTKKKIEDLATSVVQRSLGQKEPTFEIPIRSVSNMKYNKKKRILEMGSNTIETKYSHLLGLSKVSNTPQDFLQNNKINFIDLRHYSKLCL